MLFLSSKNLKYLALLLLFCSPLSAVGAAQTSTTQQEINKALDELRRHAEAGNPTAQFHLAQEYFRGKYLPKNNQMGISWATRAAEGGETDAQIGMGVLYHFGEGIVEPDYKTAMYWYRKAADGQVPLAYTYIGVLYHAGMGVDINDELAMQWITKGAENGDPFGQAILGRMHLDGDGATQDYKKAIYWLTKSANSGNSLGEYNLGRTFEFGLGVEKDQKKALHWYKKAANRGQQEARQHLAKIEQAKTITPEKNVPRKQTPTEFSALASNNGALPKNKDTITLANSNKQAPQVVPSSSTDPLPGTPPGSYTLQLMAVKDVANAIAFNNRHQIKGQIWQYQVAGTTWYLLIKGVYHDRKAANHALAQLLPTLPRGSNAWLRPVDDFRKKGVTVRNLPMKPL